jgi:hypothetical protein
MEITTQPLQVFQDRRLSEFTAPPRDVWVTNLEQTWHDLPLQEMGRTIEQHEAEFGEPVRSARGPGTYAFRPGTKTPKLTKEEGDLRIKDADLAGQLEVPEDGMRAGSLDLLIANKKEQNRRASVLNRSPGGIALGAANIAGTLAVSLLDPVNVASAFMPVVGEARYAKMLAAATGPVGRTAVRAGVGAAEGAAGAAVIEPLRVMSAVREQDAYGANDALANILFGGAFGAALHAGVVPVIKGGYRMATGRPFMERKAAAAEAISALLEDRPVRVGELLEATRARDLRGGTSLSTRTLEFRPGGEDVPSGMGFAPSPTNNAPAFSGAAEIPQMRPNGQAAIYPADLTGFKSEIGRLTKAAAKEGRALGLRQQPDGTHRLVETSKVDWLDQFPERGPAEAALKRMTPAERAGIDVVPFETEARGVGFALIRGLTKQQAGAIKADPRLADRITGAAEEPAPAGMARRMEAGDLWRGGASGQNQIAQLARESVNANLNRVLTQIRDDRVNLSPKDAAAVAEVKRVAAGYDKAPDDDGGLAELETFAADTDEALAVAKKAETLTESEIAAIDEANKMVADSEKMANGLKAATACIARAL